MIHKIFQITAMICLLSFTAVQAQLKVGDKAPEIVITDWIENVPPSKDLKGKFIVIDFWATWCAPCLESVPHMNNLVYKNRSRTNLVFLSLTNERVDKVQWLLKRVPFSSVVVADTTRRTSLDYHANAIPFCVVVDDHNRIQWFGHSSKLTDEVIGAIMDRSPVFQPDKRRSSLPEETKILYDSLYSRYRQYLEDDDLREYFSMGPVIHKKWGAGFLIGGDERYRYNGFVVGDSLIQHLAKLLNIADVQIILPDKLVGACISYCYKSELKNKKKDVLDTILHQLNLKYTIADSLVDVIQLEVADKDLFDQFLSDAVAHVSHASSSESYAAIDYGYFSQIQRTIQEEFKQIVVLKEPELFNRKMSITIQIDNRENLWASLKAHGIQANLVKRKLPVYHFEQK